MSGWRGLLRETVHYNETDDQVNAVARFSLTEPFSKTGIEFHWSGYQYMGLGMDLQKRLNRGDPAINRLDKIAKMHDIDYAKL